VDEHPKETRNSGTSRADAPRVAVVGVHGVAHHDPGATANAMADVLLSLPANDRNAPRYFPSFQSVGIRVPLVGAASYVGGPRRVGLERVETAGGIGDTRGVGHERSNDVVE
jgi:hypothetical protein